jgi:hypothetical protein
MTVKDLNLTEEQGEFACMLLNTRGNWASRKDASHWGHANLETFTVDELKASLADDDERTAKEPVRLRKTQYALRIFDELRYRLAAVGAKFKINQIVAIERTGTSPEYVQIRSVQPDKDYKGRTVYNVQDSDSFTVNETMIRALTPEEKGE